RALCGRRARRLRWARRGDRPGLGDGPGHQRGRRAPGNSGAGAGDGRRAPGLPRRVLRPGALRIRGHVLAGSAAGAARAAWSVTSWWWGRPLDLDHLHQVSDLVEVIQVVRAEPPHQATSVDSSDALASLLVAAGFSGVQVREETLRLHYPDLDTYCLV